jgi:hypothetical protein
MKERIQCIQKGIKEIPTRFKGVFQKKKKENFWKDSFYSESDSGKIFGKLLQILDPRIKDSLFIQEELAVLLILLKKGSTTQEEIKKNSYLSRRRIHRTIKELCRCEIIIVEDDSIKFSAEAIAGINRTEVSNE